MIENFNMKICQLGFLIVVVMVLGCEKSIPTSKEKNLTESASEVTHKDASRTEKTSGPAVIDTLKKTENDVTSNFSEGFAYEPTLEIAGAKTCTIGNIEYHLCETETQRALTFATGFGKNGGILAWHVTQDFLRILPIDVNGRSLGAEVDIKIPLAKQLYDIQPLGDRFWIATHGLCPDEKYFFKCLYQQLVDHNGHPLGEVHKTVTREWIYTRKDFRTSDHEFYTALGFTYIDSVVRRISLDTGGNLTNEIVRTVAFNDDYVQGKMAIAVNNTSLFITTDKYFHSNDETVKPILGIDYVNRMKWDKDGLSILAVVNSPKQTKHIRLSKSGETIEKPIIIKKDTPTPPPFESVVSFEYDSQSTTLNRFDAIHRRIGEPTVIPGGFSRIVWTGKGFLSLNVKRKNNAWEMTAVPIDCKEQTGDGLK